MCKYKTYTIIEALATEREAIGSYFNALFLIMKLITTMNDKEIKELSLQQVVACIARYRTLHFSTTPIYTSTKDEIEVMPIDVFKKNKEIDNTPYFMTINKAVFSVSPNFGECIVGEEYVKKHNIPLDNFALVPIASACVDGFKVGWNAITNLVVNEHSKGGFYTLVDLIERHGEVSIYLNINNKLPISIGSHKHKKRFPFRNSLLFTV